MADTSLEIVGLAVPHVTMVYPLPGPTRTYTLYYSQLFEEAPDQGSTGDLYVSRTTIYYKTHNDCWNTCHFNKEVVHPSIEGLYLSYDEYGPCWARGTWTRRPFREQLLPYQIVACCHRMIEYNQHEQQQQGPGSNANEPIEIDLD